MNEHPEKSEKLQISNQLGKTMYNYHGNLAIRNVSYSRQVVFLHFSLFFTEDENIISCQGTIVFSGFPVVSAVSNKNSSVSFRIIKQFCVAFCLLLIHKFADLQT